MKKLKLNKEEQVDKDKAYLTLNALKDSLKEKNKGTSDLDLFTKVLDMVKDENTNTDNIEKIAKTVYDKYKKDGKNDGEKNYLKEIKKEAKERCYKTCDKRYNIE